VDNTGAVPYPLALVITLGVEAPIYTVVLGFAGLLRGWRAVVAAVGVNVFTHPLAWALLTAYPGWLLPVEAGVCLVEAVLLWFLAGRRDAGVLMLAAVVANAASVLVGASATTLLR
jgi:hypothetical protein